MGYDTRYGRAVASVGGSGTAEAIRSRVAADTAGALAGCVAASRRLVAGESTAASYGAGVENNSRTALAAAAAGSRNTGMHGVVSLDPRPAPASMI